MTWFKASEGSEQTKHWRGKPLFTNNRLPQALAPPMLCLLRGFRPPWPPTWRRQTINLQKVTLVALIVFLKTEFQIITEQFMHARRLYHFVSMFVVQVLFDFWRVDYFSPIFLWLQGLLVSLCFHVRSSRICLFMCQEQLISLKSKGKTPTNILFSTS